MTPISTFVKSARKVSAYIAQDFITDAEFTERASELKNDAFRIVKFSRNFKEREKNSNETIVAIPSLSDKSYEIWTAAGHVGTKVNRDAKINIYSGMMAETLYGYESEKGLKEAAYDVYKNFFSIINKYPNQNILRLWNYIPNILSKDNTLERYHQFNRGRFEAWQKYGPKDEQGRPMYPAATGIGSHGGPIVIEGLTTIYPVHHLQNPRQTPAHEYSKKYGPLPPVFARATLHLPPSGPELYISGTASIVGEDAIWLDDPVMQARETLKNIEILIGDSNLATVGQKGFSFGDLSAVRVYVKRPEQLSLIKNEVEKRIDPTKIIYLYDDICRNEWLLEIEGVARKK